MPHPATAPPRRRRITLRRLMWSTVALAAVVLPATIWLASRNSQADIQPPPLPDPNGHDAVLAASLAIQKSGFPDGRTLGVTTAGADALRPWVDSNRDAVKALRDALTLPYQTPVGYNLLTHADELNRDAPIRTSGARALFAEGRLAHLDGDDATAAAAFLDLIRLGDAMSRNVPMNAYSASLAPHHLGLTGLLSLRDSAGSDVLRRVIGDLERLDAQAVPTSEPTRLELAFVDKSLKQQPGFRIPLLMSGVIARQRAQLTAQIAEASNRAAAGRRLTLAELALRLHRREHKAVPRNLDALVPSVLKAVPLDPYSGKPLIYRLVDDTYQLYSVGPDGDDDGFERALGRRHRPTDDGDFSLDSF